MYSHVFVGAKLIEVPCIRSSCNAIIRAPAPLRIDHQSPNLYPRFNPFGCVYRCKMGDIQLPILSLSAPLPFLSFETFPAILALLGTAWWFVGSYFTTRLARRAKISKRTGRDGRTVLKTSCTLDSLTLPCKRYSAEPLMNSFKTKVMEI